MRRIKCEWCGHYYDLDKNESCPKCGGNISQNMIIDTPPPKKNASPIICIFAGIGIILTFLLIVGLISDDGNDEGNNISTNVNTNIVVNEKSDLKCCDFCYDILNEQEGWYDGISYWVCTECGTEIFDDELIDTYTETLLSNSTLEKYYTDDYFIEHDDAKFYIPYVSYTDYNHAYMDYVSAEVCLEIEQSDYNQHSIDFYLVSNDKKYRIVFDNISFYDSNVKSVNDILKTSGNETFFGSAELGNDYYDGMFDSLLVSIDDKEYKIPLRYTSSIEDYDYFDNNYSLSEKINFGNQNALYIDGLNIYSSFGKTDFSFNIQTSIENISDNDVCFEVEDMNGFRYRLYENSYFCSENNILCLEDVFSFKTNNSFSISLVSYIDFDNFKSIVITINGEEHFINLK